MSSKIRRQKLWPKYVQNRLHKTNFCQPLCVCVNWYLPFFVPVVLYSPFWHCPRLRKQPTYRNATTGVPAKRHLRNKRRNPMLMTCYQADLVLLKGWSEFPSQYDLSEALPKSVKWQVITMEFLRSLLRRNLYRISRINHAIICFYPQWFCNFHT